MLYNSNPNPSDSSENSFEFRFANIKESFFITAHHFLQRKFSSFLNRTSSLTQFLRVMSTNLLPFGLNLMLFFLVVTYYSNSIDGNCSIGLFKSTDCLYESGLGFLLERIGKELGLFFFKGIFCANFVNICSLYRITLAVVIRTDICIRYSNLWTKFDTCSRWIIQCTIE